VEGTMKATIFDNQKKTYVLPTLDLIPLDNDISLILASDLEPPIEPEWTNIPKGNSSTVA
jgi:hypothetical protein